MKIIKKLFNYNPKKSSWEEFIEELKKEKEKYKKYYEEKKQKAKKYVLTISPTEYFENPKKIQEYFKESIEGKSIEEIVIKGEKINAEIILSTKIKEYEKNFFSKEKYLLGTAFIPKNKKISHQ